MALVFPPSPTVGETFTSPDNIVWMWDGAKWTATPSDVSYVPTSGGTMTGDLTINSPDGSNLVLNSPVYPGILFNYSPEVGGYPWIASLVDNNERWEVDLADGTAETGGNAGSNFRIIRFDDAGSFIDEPLAINRATGITTIENLNAPQAIGSNRVINGDMRIDQRNNGAVGTAAGYTCDRWFYGNNTAAARGSWQRLLSGAGALPLGVSYYFVFTSSSAYTSAAGDAIDLYQTIEADMIGDFAWGTADAQPVTLSFWVSALQAGVYSGAIRNQPNPTTRTYIFTFSLLANTWTKVVINIPGDTVGPWVLQGNVAGMQLVFDFGSGSTFRGPAGSWLAGNYLAAIGAMSVAATNGATFVISNVKLELGNVATPFNRKTMAESLADCQRYYQTGSTQQYLYAASSGAQSIIYMFPVSMRAAPTITTNFSAQQNATGSVAAAGAIGYQVTANVTAAGGYNIAGTWIAAAEL